VQFDFLGNCLGDVTVETKKQRNISDNYHWDPELFQPQNGRECVCVLPQEPLGSAIGKAIVLAVAGTLGTILVNRFVQ